MFTALVWLPLKYFGDHFKVSTVWHEEFTWNLILWFYSQWQHHIIKIHKLDGNLLNIAAVILSTKLDFCKIKIFKLFIQMIQRETIKFNYHKFFMLYNMLNSFYLYNYITILRYVLLVHQLQDKSSTNIACMFYLSIFNTPYMYIECFIKECIAFSKSVCYSYNIF